MSPRFKNRVLELSGKLPATLCSHLKREGWIIGLSFFPWFRNIFWNVADCKIGLYSQGGHYTGTSGINFFTQYFVLLIFYDKKYRNWWNCGFLVRFYLWSFFGGLPKIELWFYLTFLGIFGICTLKYFLGYWH